MCAVIHTQLSVYRLVLTVKPPQCGPPYNEELSVQCNFVTGSFAIDLHFSDPEYSLHYLCNTATCDCNGMDNGLEDGTGRMQWNRKFVKYISPLS